jgi:hypothetical protein
MFAIFCDLVHIHTDIAYIPWVHKLVRMTVGSKVSNKNIKYKYSRIYKPIHFPTCDSFNIFLVKSKVKVKQSLYTP